MLRRLRGRLTAVCAVATGVVLAAMAAASFVFAAEQLRGQMAERFQSAVNSVLYVLGSQPVIDHAWLLETETAEGVWIRVQSEEYGMLFTGMDSLRGELTAAAYGAAQEQGFDFSSIPSGRLQPRPLFYLVDTGTGRYRAAACRIPTDSGFLSVVMVKDRTAEREQIAALCSTYALCVVVAVVCLVAFAWLFTGRTIRPVEESRKKQTAFVSAASHELRSPLAVIQVSAEGIRDATPEEARQYGDMILREVAGLTRLTEDLLRLAGADNGTWSMDLQPANPEAMVRSVVERFERIAGGRGIRLDTSLPDQALPRIPCDRQRLEQALTVLVDNAVRFTPQGGRILVSAMGTWSGVVFLVADSGPGVPHDRRERVFDRFYQGDDARTDREHYGLGLAVAKEIVTLHKGGIQVEDSLLGGAEFRITLPIKQ